MKNDKSINQVPVWHDEKRISWTYCGRFIIYTNLSKDRFNLFKCPSFNLTTIGTFTSLETAKIIAAIIKINECKE